MGYKKERITIHLQVFISVNHIIRIICAINSTRLSSPFAINETQQPYIQDTTISLGRVYLFKTDMEQTSEESKSCFVFISSIVSPKRHLGNLLPRGRDIFSKTYFILISF